LINDIYVVLGSYRRTTYESHWHSTLGRHICCLGIKRVKSVWVGLFTSSLQQGVKFHLRYWGL